MGNLKNLLLQLRQIGIKRKFHTFPHGADTVAQIEIDCLRESGIKGIILDLDNTIVSEDDQYLSPGAEEWITQTKLAGLDFFILSNGKRHYRVKYWSHRLNIQAMSPAKKPFPSAFHQAIAYMQLHPKQVVVIGDSLHTDVLGAWLSGCCVSRLPHYHIRRDGGKNLRENGYRNLIPTSIDLGNLMVYLSIKASCR
jgi:uncharacterized protein